MMFSYIIIMCPKKLLITFINSYSETTMICQDGICDIGNSIILCVF